MSEWQVEAVLEDAAGRTERIRQVATGLPYRRTVWPPGPNGFLADLLQALRDVPGLPPLVSAESEGTRWTTVELPVSGCSLLEVCGRIRMVEGLGRDVLLPVPVMAVVLRSIVGTLMALHRRRYVYRGLHPRWVLIDTEAERVWLTRLWSIAPWSKSDGDSEPDPTDDGGRPHAATPAWDVFTLGVLTVFCITGRFPGRADDPGPPAFSRQALTALRDEALDRLRTAHGADLEPILEGTLREDPSERIPLLTVHEHLIGFLIRHRISEALVWLALGRLSPTGRATPATYAQAWRYVRHAWHTPESSAPIEGPPSEPTSPPSTRGRWPWRSDRHRS